MIRTTLNLSQNDHQELRRLAFETGVSMSELVRRFIRQNTERSQAEREQQGDLFGSVIRGSPLDRGTRP